MKHEILPDITAGRPRPEPRPTADRRSTTARCRWTLAAVAVCGACGAPALEPSAPPTHQAELRARLDAAGVTLVDSERRLSDRELLRFVHSVESFEQLGLIRPFLERIEIRRGDPDYLYGTRPLALLDRKTLIFWTWEGPNAPEPGTVFATFETHAQYFAHELGHLVAQQLSYEHLEKFATLFEFSRPGYLTSANPHHPEPKNRVGDFVSSYANTNLEEDLAETFAFVILGPSPWRWTRDMAAAFEHHPVLAKKLDVMMTHVATVGPGAVPVLMAVEDDGGPLPFSLVPAFVDGPDPWSVPADFGGPPSSEAYEFACDEADRCGLVRRASAAKRRCGDEDDSSCPTFDEDGWDLDAPRPRMDPRVAADAAAQPQ